MQEGITSSWSLELENHFLGGNNLNEHEGRESWRNVE
jgi:hypothetical protein